MARISTYPILSAPTLNDLLIGTDVEDLNNTRNFSIGDIGTLVGQFYVPYVGATGNVNLGAYSIQASAFIVPGGLSSQFVKADGTLDSTAYTPQSRTLTINGVTYNLSQDRTWNLGTIDTLTTNGTGGAATYSAGVLNIPIYQSQGNYITQLSGEATASGPGNATVTLSNSAVINKILTGLNITGGNVVATDSILEAFGKVQNQINGLIGGVQYQGTWDAATNSPFLQSSVGVQGHYYVVNVAGNTNLNGITSWNVGDWAIYDGTAWNKVDNTDAVVSVNGYTGAVDLTYSDVDAAAAALVLTINGVGYDLSTNRSWTVGDVRTDSTYYNPTWITALAWSKIINTPTTLAGYGITDAVSDSRTLTINGVGYDLSQNRSWSVGTITSISTISPLTGGTITSSGSIGITQSGSVMDGYLSSADWNTFDAKQDALVPVGPITLVGVNIGITQSGPSSDGYLSSADWNTFNDKQDPITNPVTGTGTPYTIPMWSSVNTISDSNLSYASDTFTFEYNSITGASVVFTNIGSFPYTYSIQMNNFGSPRATIHEYSDGEIIQTISGVQVSKIFPDGTTIIGTSITTNGSLLQVYGDLFVDVITNAVTDTDKFLVSDSGVVKYRTGSEVLSDIGAVPTTRELTINGVSYDLSANRTWSVGTVTSVDMSVPTGFSIGGTPVTGAGTLALSFSAGYSLPTDAVQSTWTNAYNRSLTSAAVTGTTTKTLTLNQQDGGTITATWSDFDTAPVTSVFGRTGAIIAQSGDYTTTLVTEGTNLYFTDARSRAAISLTTIGSSGPSTYSNLTGVINIPDYGSALIGYVPYTGATGNVNLGEWGFTTGFVTFDTTPTNIPAAQGSMYWDDSRSTVALIMNGTIQHIGQDSYYYVKNSSGFPIPKGTAVRFAGTDGASGHILIAPFLADGTYPSSYFMGVTSEAIANGGFGQVTQFGEIEGFNTSGYSAGALLYASTTVAGSFQTTAPVAPNNIVLVAATLNSKNNGTIIVRPTYGSNINDDEGVLINIPLNNQGLFYDSASTLWVNKTIAQALGYTPVADSRTLTINGTTYDLTANRTWSVGTVTSVDMSVPTGFAIGGNPVTSSGTLALSFASGYSLPTNASQANWDIAYNNRITSLTTTGTGGSATLVANVLNIPIYQTQGNYITSLTGEVTASGPGASAATLSNAAVIGKVLTGLSVVNTPIVATDTIVDAFGKLQGQVNALVGGLQYQGTWNASTNTPTITSGVGTDGYFYIVSVAGTTNIDGITDWQIGDWIVFHGSAWQKVDNTDSVTSVNGFTGAVVLTTSDIGEGTNLYFTNSRARQAINLTTIGNSGISTYSNITGVLNVPEYTIGGLGGVPTSRTLTINGTSYDLSSNRSWSVGTVTSISTSGPITGGTITGVGTIGITQSSSSTDGYLSSIDWNTFNNKQNALINPVTGTGTSGYLSKFTGATSIANSLFFENGAAIGLATTSIDASALFQMDSTTRGFLTPRMTQAQRQAISSPADGLIVYQTNGVIGLYIYANATWRSLTMV
jgi:predicted heme/steroid binding protein